MFVFFFFQGAPHNVTIQGHCGHRGSTGGQELQWALWHCGGNMMGSGYELKYARGDKRNATLPGAKIREGELSMSQKGVIGFKLIGPSV